jgi:hypothetical protein
MYGAALELASAVGQTQVAPTIRSKNSAAKRFGPPLQERAGTEMEAQGTDILLLYLGYPKANESSAHGRISPDVLGVWFELIRPYMPIKACSGAPRWQSHDSLYNVGAGQCHTVYTRRVLPSTCTPWTEKLFHQYRHLDSSVAAAKRPGRKGLAPTGTSLGRSRTAILLPLSKSPMPQPVTPFPAPSPVQMVRADTDARQWPRAPRY